MTPPLPPEERERLAALYACDVIDTPREPPFDNIVFTAAQIFRVPIAMLALIDETRIWVKAGVGRLPPSWDRTHAVNRLVAPTDDLLIIEDTAKDGGFNRAPAIVADLQIRFCASTPVRGPGHHIIGALSVMDRNPRSIPDRQRMQLQQLARETEQLLRLRAPERNVST